MSSLILIAIFMAFVPLVGVSAADSDTPTEITVELVEDDSGEIFLDPAPVEPVFFDELVSVGDPADFEWFPWNEGDDNFMKMIGEFTSPDFTLTAGESGSFLAISPVERDGVVAYHPLPFIGAGSIISVQWAAYFEDTIPYVDLVTLYFVDEEGEVIPWFVKTVFDGSSPWSTDHFIAPTDGTYLLFAGAFNVLDETINPMLFVGDVSIEAPTEPVPLPLPAVLLSSAVLSLAFLRRRLN